MPLCSAFVPLPGIHGLSILRLQLRPTQMVIMIQVGQLYTSKIGIVLVADPLGGIRYYQVVKRL